jgi:hypothetical protein
MTDVVVTQVGTEVWAAGSSTVRVSQVGEEVWAAGASTVRVSQFGMEVWARAPVVAGAGASTVMVIVMS